MRHLFLLHLPWLLLLGRFRDLQWGRSLSPPAHQRPLSPGISLSSASFAQGSFGSPELWKDIQTYRRLNDRAGGHGLKRWASIVLLVTFLIPINFHRELYVWLMRGRHTY